MVAEKKRKLNPEGKAEGGGSGINKKTWNEERQKAEAERLAAHGIDDASKAYLLEPLEKAQDRYDKIDKKKPAAFGWDAFNQKSLYNAYAKRADAIPVDMAAYEAAKAADPEFYRDADSLLHGHAPAVPQANIDRMAAEIEERKNKRKDFSRRRKHYEERDVDSINDRNAFFNKKARPAPQRGRPPCFASQSKPVPDRCCAGPAAGARVRIIYDRDQAVSGARHCAARPLSVVSARCPFHH